MPLAGGVTGIGETLRDSAIVNFTGAVTMVVDDSPFSMELTTQVLHGFGVKVQHACRSGAEAIGILQDSNIDLLLVSSDMSDMNGYDLVHWLRRSGLEPNAYVPVVMTAGHVRRSQLQLARDCGVNFLITKPFSAVSLLERIVWVARDNRPFLQAGDYFGPDRRIREGEPPGDERRADMISRARAEAERIAAEEAEMGAVQAS